MCGIAGMCSGKVDSNIMRDMVDSLHHRGPDAKGIFVNEKNTVALGNTRLSIIDLSEKANQPMQTADGNFTIVFNGEIYDFQELRKDIGIKSSDMHFRTYSDTETVLFAYSQMGYNMLPRLEGMFALAIYDKVSDELFLCRDRLGKKPLFYFHDSNEFIFASEIKSFLKCPSVKNNLTISETAIYLFLHFGFIPEPYTIYNEIKKFPAAHYGILKNNHLEIKSYWQINIEPAPEKSTTLETALNGLHSGLTRSVSNRLVSHVPLGVFLRGGTDSSLVTALAVELAGGKLKTFSIGFDENKYDESDYARKVAGHLHTDHYEFRLSDKQAMDILYKYLIHFDEPFADTSAIPTMMVSELARKEVTVALTGDGGDELFMGYGSYDWANRLNHKATDILKPLISFGLNYSGNNRLCRISHMFERVPANGIRSHIFSQEQYLFSQNEIKDRLAFHPLPDFRFAYTDPGNLKITPAEKQALFDISYYLKDDLLVKVDRASMLNSLECRCPFLDYRVVEMALNLPYHLKKKGRERKWILKKLLSKYLPPSLVYRPKWGFSIPLDKWLKEELQFLINDHLNRSTVEDLGIINYSYVEEMKKSFFRGYDYFYNRLWQLIVLHKWLRENGR